MPKERNRKKGKCSMLLSTPFLCKIHANVFEFYRSRTGELYPTRSQNIRYDLYSHRTTLTCKGPILKKKKGTNTNLLNTVLIHKDKNHVVLLTYFEIYLQVLIGWLFSLKSTCAIITRGLITFYPIFEVHLCTVTFGLMYG